MTCLCVESASKRDLVKPLYKNRDALEEKERLPAIVWDCRKTPAQFRQEECPASLIGPSVSMAIWANRWDADKLAYFETFLSEAASAALPVTWALTATWVNANVSTIVVSQVKQRPPCHGTSVNPSGRLSSSGSKPDGSLTYGMSALHSARQTRQLMCLWRMERHALRLLESPCMPLASTAPPRFAWI